MSEPDGNDRNGNNVWHENNILYAPRPPEFVPMTAATSPTGNYMMPNAQEAFIAANNGHHQSSIHHNQPPQHQPSQHQQQQQQLHHHMAAHTSQQPQHQQQHMPQFIHNTDYSTPRNDGFTLLRTAHGDYLKVFYNNENAMNYNNYELFSNNSYSPHQMMKPQTQTHQSAPIPQETNFLNQLVENWTPNMSGTYKPFGESPLPPPPMSSSTVSQTGISLPQSHTHTEPLPMMSSRSHVEHEIAAMSAARMQEPNEMAPSVIAQPSRTNGNTNGSFLHDSTIKASVGSDVVKKPRMVAEVKPMRMSYSDVLSKNVFINKQNPSDSNGNGTNFTSSGGQVANGVSNVNSAQPKSSKSDKNKNAYSEKKSNHNYDDKESSRKNVTQSSYTSSQGAAVTKSGASSNVGGDTDRDIRSGDNDGRQAKKKSGAAPTAPNASGKGGANRAKAEVFTKRRSQSDMNSSGGTSQTSSKDEAEKNAQNSGFFYNITKNEPQLERSSSGAGSTSGKSYQHRKNVSNKFASASATATRGNGSGSGSSKTDKTTQYQQKRAQKSRDNTTYALAEKMFKTWLEYVLRFLNWLICELVFDVIMLSCGIMLDRMAAGIDHTRQFFVSLRTELFTNSARPSSYFWNLWLRFDKKFGKESKWAFWRRLFAKKKPPEPTPEFYKNGRLPQTGDEAMYSLLNCKGKDAYSILGVQADCSQEQIRKHYKKIAVLVHPDKNKQPGAEEAFKILQRAFELIGEPENRKSYDQSVAEALNAEKAWSELNDLLRQLQTKIAEAANTIRCSSCGLRHPRKPTGRPHFAARQCNTCKIRHTAREGDIWAETTLFGLRWKYLALMEGKVLDITEWANCQKGALSHLQPNSHIVQYRIVLGGQNQQQNQQQHHHQQQQQQDKDRIKRDQTTEPSLDEFLDNLYSGQNPQNNNNSNNNNASGSRRRNRKN